MHTSGFTFSLVEIFIWKEIFTFRVLKLFFFFILFLLNSNWFEFLFLIFLFCFIYHLSVQKQRIIFVIIKWFYSLTKKKNENKTQREANLIVYFAVETVVYVTIKQTKLSRTKDRERVKKNQENNKKKKYKNECCRWDYQLQKEPRRRVLWIVELQWAFNCKWIDLHFRILFYFSLSFRCFSIIYLFFYYFPFKCRHSTLEKKLLISDKKYFSFRLIQRSDSDGGHEQQIVFNRFNRTIKSVMFFPLNSLVLGIFIFHSTLHYSFLSHFVAVCMNILIENVFKISRNDDVHNL